MNGVTFHLRARDPALVAAWHVRFDGLPGVVVSEGDIFGVPADVLVSPANSFGDMTGGIDALYTRRLGPAVVGRLQTLLRDEYDGELPVGCAVLVPTDDPVYRHLLCAPTMRVPADVSATVNAYLAFGAVLRCVRRFNVAGGGVGSVLCPGLATGTGAMPPHVCARQMRAAWDRFAVGPPPRFDDLNEALLDHWRLIRPEDP